MVSFLWMFWITKLILRGSPQDVGFCDCIKHQLTLPSGNFQPASYPIPFLGPFYGFPRQSKHSSPWCLRTQQPPEWSKVRGYLHGGSTSWLTWLRGAGTSQMQSNHELVVAAPPWRTQRLRLSHYTHVHDFIQYISFPAQGRWEASWLRPIIGQSWYSGLVYNQSILSSISKHHLYITLSSEQVWSTCKRSQGYAAGLNDAFKQRFPQALASTM